MRRIGLNSGPVTAGVLRGERARFQLFGDTVNTASRIETTGQRDRVHVSEQTAKFLKAAGHGDWVVPRDDAVQAKGKGLINTYWLILGDDQRIEASEGAYMEEEEAVSFAGALPDDEDGGSTTGSDSKDRSHHRSVLKGMMDPAVSRKVERLVAWNTELLLQLLKAIVAKRNAVSGRKMMPAALTAMAQNIASDGMVVDEVTEIIQMPDFDDRLSSKKIDINSVQLSSDVINQTKRFVSLIASMYRENPFHNFEVCEKDCLQNSLHVGSLTITNVTSYCVKACIPCDNVCEQVAISDCSTEYQQGRVCCQATGRTHLA